MTPSSNPRDVMRLRQRDYAVLYGLALAFLIIVMGLGRVSVTVGLFGLAGFSASALLYHQVMRRAALRDARYASRVARSRPTTRMAGTLTDALPQATVLLDGEGRVVHANRLARDLINIDTTGRPFAVYLRDPGVGERLSQALAGTAPPPLLVHSEVPAERYISCLFSAATNLEGGTSRALVLVVLNDVTKIMRANQQQADFLANASHELKTPLASMLGYIETLRGHARDDPEAQQRFLGIMQQQAERMQRLINDLLSLRRIEQTEHIAPTETADLDLAIRAAIESIAPLAERRDIQLKYKRTKKAIVSGHQDETIQLCLNLIENATKISVPGDTVHITLRRFEHWTLDVPFADGRLPASATARALNPASTAAQPLYTITISDTGPGFSRGHIPRIGERFYRIAGDLSSKEKGTGLGLAIVKHIARRHRAGLYLRSQNGAGTEWCIVYPARDTAGTQSAKSEAAKSETKESSL